jgi:hypothetical protein
MSSRKPRKAEEATPSAGNGGEKRAARRTRSGGNPVAAEIPAETIPGGTSAIGTSLREAAGGHMPGSAEDLHARIAECAYDLYERRGRQDGFELDDWLEAERRVLGTQSQIKQQAGSS